MNFDEFADLVLFDEKVFSESLIQSARLAIRKAVENAVLEEREACAKIAESSYDPEERKICGTPMKWMKTPEEIAERIRKRGE